MIFYAARINKSKSEIEKILKDNSSLVMHSDNIIYHKDSIQHAPERPKQLHDITSQTGKEMNWFLVFVALNCLDIDWYVVNEGEKNAEDSCLTRDIHDQEDRASKKFKFSRVS